MHRRSETSDFLRLVRGQLQISHISIPCQPHINPCQVYSPTPAQAVLFSNWSAAAAVLSLPLFKAAASQLWALVQGNPTAGEPVENNGEFQSCSRLLQIPLLSFVCSNPFFFHKFTFGFCLALVQCILWPSLGPTLSCPLHREMHLTSCFSFLFLLS